MIHFYFKLEIDLMTDDLVSEFCFLNVEIYEFLFQLDNIRLKSIALVDPVAKWSAFMEFHTRPAMSA